MLRTSLYNSHRALGAKMVSFGGWEMPREYRNGVASEVKAVRTDSGIFDISHMGEFYVEGKEALDFVQHITTNDASRLESGDSQYTLILNEEGGVIDDVIVSSFGSEFFRFVVNAGCIDKDWHWFSQQARSFKVELSNPSGLISRVALQGPNAVAKLESLIDLSLAHIGRFECCVIILNGEECSLSRTGYTGEDGVEISWRHDEFPVVWDTLIAAGYVPCGLAARDVLRLEAAYPLYGHELNENEIPLGLGLGWAIKTSKPNFIGRNKVIELAQDGIRDRLVGLITAAPNAIPREGQLVFSPVVEEPIGRVTSGTLSPTLGKGIALARIGAGFAEIGAELVIDIRGRKANAIVTKLPFYRGLKR